MAISRYGLCAAAMLALGACGAGLDRNQIRLVEACMEGNPDDSEVCVCTARSIKQALGPQEFSELADFVAVMSGDDDPVAQGAAAMAAFTNPRLMDSMSKLEDADRECVAETARKKAQAMRASGKLSGRYLPQLGDVDEGSRRLAAAMTDRQWEFSEEGFVVTHSQRGAIRWSYQISGQEIRLQGVDSSNRGERRRFTFTQDGRCIWDGTGRSSVDMRFCPA